MKKKKAFRLKKGPDIQDFVVEETFKSGGSVRQGYTYWSTRREARIFAKVSDADIVRVFRIRYELVNKRVK